MTNTWDRLLGFYTDYLRAERGLGGNTVSSYAGDINGYIVFLKKKGISGPDDVDPHVPGEYVSGLFWTGMQPATIFGFW